MDKKIQKMEKQDIKSTLGTAMLICDLIQETNKKSSPRDKMTVFSEQAGNIARALVENGVVDENIITKFLEEDHTELVEDFFELWGKTRKICIGICGKKE
jgi:hypothetical protein